MDRIGRYKIVRELGRGAMGVVYHAIDPNIGRPVAIKTIQLGGGRKPEEQERLRERLFREARSAGMLSHPGIVTIYDVEQQGDLAYIAMEYVDGPTLDQLLADQPPIAAEQLFSILGQTAAALDYAHQKGIVHRDIKPANIMIAQDGTAKITDFGIAKITASEQFTMTGSIVGTPHYMSPEQVQGHAGGRAVGPVFAGRDRLRNADRREALHGRASHHGGVQDRGGRAGRAAPLEPDAQPGHRGRLWPRPWPRNRTRATAPARSSSTRWRRPARQTKGWKLMARGGSLNEPTLAEQAPAPTVSDPGGRVTLPRPVHPKRLGDTTVTSAREGGRKAGLLTFLLAILVAGGLLALIGFQAAPWLGSPAPANQTASEESPSLLRRRAGVRANRGSSRRAVTHRPPVRLSQPLRRLLPRLHRPIPARQRHPRKRYRPPPNRRNRPRAISPVPWERRSRRSPTVRPGRWKNQPCPSPSSAAQPAPPRPWTAAPTPSAARLAPWTPRPAATPWPWSCLVTRWSTARSMSGRARSKCRQSCCGPTEERSCSPACPPAPRFW